MSEDARKEAELMCGMLGDEQLEELIKATEDDILESTVQLEALKAEQASRREASSPTLEV